MDWKYIGRGNAGRLIEAMKSTTEAIGAQTVVEQIELLESAQEDIAKVLIDLRLPRCGICNEITEFGGRICISCQSQVVPGPNGRNRNS